MALPLIRSLNEKSKKRDIAIEKMINPPVQGPPGVKKSYISTSANSFIPIDYRSAAAGKGITPIFELNSQLYDLTASVEDERQIVDTLYYSNYLLYLMNNPKTRTATESNSIVNEQKLAIGPHLQSLNFTYNNPLVEYIMDYVLYEDLYLPSPPKGLEGSFIKPEYISLFAQSQRSADLPTMDRFIEDVSVVAAHKEQIWDNIDVDQLVNFWEDRYFLPPGIKRQGSEVRAMREQRLAKHEQQMKIAQLLELEKTKKGKKNGSPSVA